MIKRKLTPNRPPSIPGGGHPLTMWDYFPELQTARFELTPAEVRGAFTTPVVLVPGKANICHSHGFVEFSREAGTAYGNLSGNLLITRGAQVSTLLSLQLSQTLGVTNSVVHAAANFGGVSTGLAGSVAIAGEDINFRLSAQDATGGTGRIYIVLMWYDWNVTSGFSTIP
jgi:hypothetical protein